MPFFKDLENKVHFLESVEFIGLLPSGSVEITNEEAEELTALPPASTDNLIEEVRQALQEAIDIKAKSLGFSGGNALILYAGFENHYQSISQVFATWEASVWVEADAYKAEVLAGNKPMLTGAQAVELMPAYPD